jgi:glycosyltransferase involved in cell wall biosynthesis
MDIQSQIACIIPFYNEGIRLDNVLDTMIRVKYITEMICVDDCSAEDRTKELQQKYPSVKFIRLEKNLGKTGAIQVGVKSTACEYIMFFDADLNNLDTQEIENATKAIATSKDIDMLILRRVLAPGHVKVTRADVLLTGERILRKSDFELIMQQGVKGYQLETAINYYMYKNKKKVYWISFSGLNMHRKADFWTDFKRHTQVTLHVIMGAGPINLIKIIRNFAKEEYKPANS